MVNVCGYDPQVDFRKRERGRESDEARFRTLAKRKVQVEVYKAMDAFDRKLAERDKKNSQGGHHGLRQGHPEGGASSDEEANMKDADIEELNKKKQKELNDIAKKLGDLHLYRKRPCSPVLHYDYGHASTKPIAFKPPSLVNKPTPVSERRFLTNHPCGSQYPYTVLEPIYMQPRLEPKFAEDRGWFEEQPILRHASFTNIENAKEKALMDFFRKNKVSGLKGMTNAYAKSYSFVTQCQNQARVQMACEAQRIYDGMHGVTFKNMEDVHWEWLEQNASDKQPLTAWLYKPKSEWTDMQKKTFDILSFLHRDLLRNEKKSLRHLFLQTTKVEDWMRTIEPHCSDMAMNLDGPRLLRNLEMRGVVNSPNRPALFFHELHNFMELCGDGYDGVISLDKFTETMRKFSIVYLKHSSLNDKERSQERERKVQKARSASTDNFVRQHWSHHNPIVGVVKT